MDQTRKVWIDVLNIIACLGVVILHCSNHEIHNYNGDVTYEFIWGCFTHTIFFWPVPIFFMISGTNLLDYNGSWKKFYNRRFERTVIPFLIWSIFYYILFNRNDITFTTILQNLVSGSFHLWFFIPLFAFYLSVPFLNYIIKRGKVVIKYYLILSLICSSICPFIFECINIKISNIFPLSGSYLFIPILGYYLVKYPLSSRCKNNIYKLAVLGGIIHWVLLFYTIQYNKELKDIVLDYDSPLCILMASAIFISYKDFNWNTLIKRFKISTKLVTIVSSCSLGIYLIHIFIIIILNKLIPVNYGVLNFTSVYIVSLLIIYMMKRIPIVKNIVP